MNSDLPDKLRREVIAELYRRADQLGWDGLSGPERSIWYTRWVEDPKIGGVLSRYMPLNRVRVWIKDVPMKEYTRARSGIGKYSDLVETRFPSPEEIAHQVFGREWRITNGTVREKPNRCEISNGQQRILMIWGPPAGLRDLVWAGMNAMIDSRPTPTIVITTLQGQKLTEGEKRRHIALGRQAGLEIWHTTVRLIRVTPEEKSGALGDLAR